MAYNCPSLRRPSFVLSLHNYPPVLFEVDPMGESVGRGSRNHQRCCRAIFALFLGIVSRHFQRSR